MKNQHTPGNWSCQKSETSRPESVRLDIVTDAGEYSPAFIAGDALPADAHLLASAPDLLSALIALEKASREVLDTSATHDGLKNCKILVEARIAIEKAGGEWK